MCMFCISLICRHSTKYDVILFDNASEIDELTSTLSLLFSPSALILFGDSYRKPKDSLSLNDKYGSNLNQSMFQRIYNAGQCIFNLRHTARFSIPVLNFLNHCFYENALRQHVLPQTNRSAVAGFGLFHRRKDDLTYTLLSCLMEVLPPREHSYAIIMPPFISSQDMNGLLG